MSSKIDVLLDEKRFPYLGMSKDERNYYLNIVRNCKDICDTENKVGNISKCVILEMYFKKENNIVSFSGSLSIGSEKRCIEGDLFLEKDRIIVDYKITRLCVESEINEYVVLDEFKLEDDVLKRRSQYSYNMKSIYNVVKDELMRGRLR